MRIIVITTPHFWQGEAQAINALFTAGLETLHLRKPDSSLEEVETLLSEIEPKYLCRIVVHDHFELAARYPLHGVHLNQRNPAPLHTTRAPSAARATRSMR